MQCKRSPGYDLISAQLLKEFPSCGIKFIRNICHAMFRLLYFPKVWKIAQITAIPKPVKDTTLSASYRPISLLPVISKMFETILAGRLEPFISACNVIANHQFGFRKSHSTIQQVHRVTNKILSDFENKKFCRKLGGSRQLNPRNLIMVSLITVYLKILHMKIHM